MPIGGPSWQQQRLRRRYSGWAAPSATTTPVAANVLIATDVDNLGPQDDDKILRWFLPWGTWRRVRRPPGDLSLQGHHPNADPVSKPYSTKASGNIHRGGTFVGWGEPRKRCWSRQSPLVAPADLVNWEGIAQWVWVVKGRGRWRRRIGVYPATGAPPSGTLEWGGVISSWCRSGRLPPMNFDTQWPRTFPHAPGRLDTVANSPSRNASLVEGTAGGPLPWWLQGIHVKNMGIFQSTKAMKLGNGGR